jgi:hypothetical protein
MANWIETEDGEWINADFMTTAKYATTPAKDGRSRLMFYEGGKLAGVVQGTKAELKMALGVRSRFRMSPEVTSVAGGTKSELKAVIEVKDRRAAAEGTMI